MKKPAKPSPAQPAPAKDAVAPDPVTVDPPAPEAAPQILAEPDLPPDLPPDPGQPPADPPAEHATPASVRAPAGPERRRSPGFLPMVLGGVVAAGLGFGLARFALPDGWPFPGTAALTATVAEHSQALSDLRAAPVGGDLLNRLQALETRLAAAEAQLADTAALADLSARVSALESRPAGTGEVDLTPLRAEIEALRAEMASRATATLPTAEIEAAAAARMAEMEAQANALRAEAEAAARTADLRAALAQVQTAIDAGLPFADPLAALESAGATVPADLRAAVDGVASLATLQETFPDAARAALEASVRATTGEGLGDRLAAFLRIQTGARSLEPREGTDADAILSQAEAALRGGDLDATLALIATLPAEGQTALADWSEVATARLTATQSLTALSASLNP